MLALLLRFFLVFTSTSSVVSKMEGTFRGDFISRSLANQKLKKDLIIKSDVIKRKFSSYPIRRICRLFQTIDVVK